MNVETQLYMSSLWDRLGHGFYWVEVRNGKKYIAKPVNIEFVELVENEQAEPTLFLDYPHSREVLPLLAKLISENGIKPDVDSKLEGKLIATERHLEDMRRLVFRKEADDERK